MNLLSITKENFFSRLEGKDKPWQKNYLAMYSSQWDGVTHDPDLMMIPVDDHLVHRGDGVFDVMRCIRGKIYQLKAHLDRLERSASAISLALPLDRERIGDLIKDVVLAGGEKDCLVRVIVSRGPGSFSTNPFDCPASHIYVNAIRIKTLPEAYYRDGVPLVTSQVPIKQSFFANIKSCNYLPNVLMKMEAVQEGCEYSVALDEEGYLAEGSIENVAVLDQDDIFRLPGFERTLSGITANRIFQLAADLVKKGAIRDVHFAKITPQEAYQAKEMFLTGTSINILPVISYDGRPIGEGCPGPVYRQLRELLWQDMTENEDLLTEIEWSI